MLMIDAELTGPDSALERMKNTSLEYREKHQLQYLAGWARMEQDDVTVQQLLLCASQCMHRDRS